MALDPCSEELPVCRIPGCERVAAEPKLYLCDVHADEVRIRHCEMCGSTELQEIMGWLEGRVGTRCVDCHWYRWQPVEELF